MRRKLDAWALLGCGARHARGAAYLGGYAVECKLKAIAMELFDCWTLAELARRWRVDDRAVYQHGLEALASRLPLWTRLKASPTSAKSIDGPWPGGIIRTECARRLRESFCCR